MYSQLLSDYNYMQSLYSCFSILDKLKSCITQSHTLGCRFLQPPNPGILIPYTSCHTICSISFVTIESLSMSNYIHKHIDTFPYRTTFHAYNLIYSYNIVYLYVSISSFFRIYAINSNLCLLYLTTCHHVICSLQCPFNLISSLGF